MCGGCDCTDKLKKPEAEVRFCKCHDDEEKHICECKTGKQGE